MVILPQVQPVQLQAVGGTGGQRHPGLRRLPAGEGGVLLRQVHQRDGAAFFRVMDAVASRPAADVQDGVPGADVLVHHPGGQDELHRVPGAQAVPLLLCVLVVKLPDSLDVLFHVVCSFSHALWRAAIS